MKKLVLVLVVAAGVAALASTAGAACSGTDFNNTRDSILAGCPCTGNHGQYVSCITRAVREAVRNDQLDINCKGKVVRCAARSTCGHKSTFVTCSQCVPGTCDTTAGLCDDGVTACTDSSQCPQVVNRCTTKSSAEHCQALGGVVGSGSCCAATCAPQ